MTNVLPLHSIGVDATTVFTKLYDNASVSTGSNTNKMRAIGHAVDSIVIDCQITNKRIGVMVPDGASEFAIAIVNKDDTDNCEQIFLPLDILTPVGA